MLVDQVLALGDVEHPVQDFVAFRFRQAVDPHRHQPVDIERRPAARRVGDADRVGAAVDRLRLRALALAAVVDDVIVEVVRGPAPDPLPDPFGQRLVSEIVVGEFCVAALARHLDRVQGGAAIGHRLEDRVVVEKHLAVRQRADRLAVDADVGDQHHRVVDRGRVLRPLALGPGAGADAAERRGEAELLFLGEAGRAEQQHDVVAPRRPQRPGGVRVDRRGDVEPDDLRAERIRQRPDLEALHAAPPSARTVRR